MSEHHHDPQAPLPPDGATAIDPVCGMSVRLGIGKPTYDYGGTTYHFCSEGCRLRFGTDPKLYLKSDGGTAGQSARPRAADDHAGRGPSPSSAAVAPAAPGGALYTCPMHPEIVRDRPGSCPICGMALEPMVADRHAKDRTPNLST